jgi:hypothetical protein
MPSPAPGGAAKARGEASHVIERRSNTEAKACSRRSEVSFPPPTKHKYRPRNTHDAWPARGPGPDPRPFSFSFSFSFSFFFFVFVPVSRVLVEPQDRPAARLEVERVRVVEALAGRAGAAENEQRRASGPFLFLKVVFVRGRITRVLFRKRKRVVSRPHRRRDVFGARRRGLTLVVSLVVVLFRAGP